MVEEYAKTVIDLVKETANTREGMAKIITTAEETITKVDKDMVELLSQRSDLARIYKRFNDLYEIMIGEEVRSMQKIASTVKLPTDFALVNTSESFRQGVLVAANALVKESSFVPPLTDDGVLDYVKDNMGNPPWKNPKAVIATILLRSGKWKKEEPGRFARVEEEE